MGNTRSHPEHDGKDASGRWYCTGDGVGEQVAARLRKKEQMETSAEYRHRHWKVSPVGNRVEPEEI